MICTPCSSIPFSEVDEGGAYYDHDPAHTFHSLFHPPHDHKDRASGFHFHFALKLIMYDESSSPSLLLESSDDSLSRLGGRRRVSSRNERSTVRVNDDLRSRVSPILVGRG